MANGRCNMIAIEFGEVWRKGLRQAIVVCVALTAVAISSLPAVGQEKSVTVTDVAQEEQSQPAHSGETQRESPFVNEYYDLTEAQKSNIRKLEVFTYLWFLMLGASAGSFLNVVIYRLPAGRRLFGRSMCPGCDQQIPWRDNIPILGWLRLRGRCRACNIWIPVRYPAVEALIGGWFALLLAIELLSGGETLPVRNPYSYNGVVWIIWYTKWDLIGIYLFHCFLVCVVVAATLMQWDGHPLPRRFAWFAVAMGVIAPVFWRHLHPVSFHEPRWDWLTHDWRWQVAFNDPFSGWQQHFGVGLDGLLDSVAGLVAGLLTGWLIARSLGRGAFPETAPHGENESQDAPIVDAGREHTRGFCLLFAVVVMFLGWQSAAPLAIGVSTITIVLNAVSRMTGDPRWRRNMTNTAIAIAVLLQILLWRMLTTVDAWPDHTGWPVFANSSWWPVSSCEPFASLALAVAVGCLISRAHSLVAVAESEDADKGADRALSDSESRGAHPE